MLLDVNVLIYAHRRDAERHEDYRAWVERLLEGHEPYAVSDFVITGFLRVVTNPRTYREPATLGEALGFADQVRNHPGAIVTNPGRRFWEIFTELCNQAKAKAKLVPDAYLAALAIEHGCEVVTADWDFARFRGLRWWHPLD